MSKHTVTIDHSSELPSIQLDGMTAAKVTRSFRGYGWNSTLWSRRSRRTDFPSAAAALLAAAKALGIALPDAEG